MSGVEVSVARSDEKGAIENLIQLYHHDFSEQWCGTSRGELENDGRFPEYPLEVYWREPAHLPLLLRMNQRLVGFALLNASSPSGRGVEHNMAEFFIARKHRRCGVGTTAAQGIFSCYSGQWETAVARQNVGALEFWRKAITRHSLARDVEEFDVTTDSWNGPVIRFRIKKADSAP